MCLGAPGDSQVSDCPLMMQMKQTKSRFQPLLQILQSSLRCLLVQMLPRGELRTSFSVAGQNRPDAKGYLSFEVTFGIGEHGTFLRILVLDMVLVCDNRYMTLCSTSTDTGM